jgi:type VI secretion system protein ImpI
MPLLLEVVSAHAGGMGSNRRWVLDSGGVKIGRDETCDWVIADPYISRHHVTVRCVLGMYFVEGKGRNPIALNERSRILRNDDPHPVSDGDVLYIDEYEVRMTQIDEAAVGRILAERSHVRERPGSEPAQPMPRQGELDPIKLLGGIPPEPRRPAPAPAITASDPILDVAYRPPSVATPAPGLSEDWLAPTPSSEETLSAALPTDWMNPRQPAKTGPSAGANDSRREDRPKPQTAVPQPVVSDEVLRRLLSAAGLDASQVNCSPEMAAQVGAALRLVVQGTMEMLRSRSEVKSQFRLPGTQIAVNQNNPLKFSTDAHGALFSLFVKPDPAFMGMEEAFRDAFEDIRFHQLAVLRGLQAGFDRMLSTFDPERLQQRAEAGGGALRSLAGGKSRLWDAYAEEYSRYSSDREDAFRRLFGDAFGKAYEEELRKLKSLRPGAGPRGRS